MYIPDPNSPPIFPFQEDTIHISGLSPGLAAVILVGSLLTFALVNAVEIAMVSVSRIRVKHLVDQDNARAEAVERIRAHQERFFAFVVLLQSLSVILTSTMGSILALEAVGGVGGFILGTIVMTVVIALFGEVTPKILGAHAPERFPLLVARPVEVLLWLLRPLVMPLAAAPSYLSRLL